MANPVSRRFANTNSDVRRCRNRPRIACVAKSHDQSRALFLIGETILQRALHMQQFELHMQSSATAMVKDSGFA